MKNKLVATIILIVLLLISTTVVKAEATATVTLKPSKTQVKAGETFTVTVHVKSEQGINGFMGKLSYDHNKLELISGKVADSSKWGSLGGNNEEIALMANEATIKEDDIYTLTFKVKEGTKEGTEISININEINVDTFAENDSTVLISEVTVKLTTVKEQTSGNDQNPGEGEEPGEDEEPGDDGESGEDEEPGEDGNPGADEEPGEDEEPGDDEEPGADEEPGDDGNPGDDGEPEEKDNTKTPASELPNAGISYIIMAVSIIAVLTSAVASFKAYKKYENI